MRSTSFAFRQQNKTAVLQDHAKRMMDVWTQVAVAVARSDNAIRASAAIDWADKIVEAYAERVAAIQKEIAK
jgi:hypothetical protein